MLVEFYGQHVDDMDNYAEKEITTLEGMGAWDVVECED